jgi:hypothetical protein
MKKFLLVFVFVPIILFPQNVMSIDNIQATVLDTVSLDINITNSQQFVAFQTDIKLPLNFTYINNSASLTSRANGHILSANLLAGNVLRVLAFTLNQNTFNGDSGAVLNFRLAVGDSAGLFPIELITPIISNSNSQNILTTYLNGFVTVQEMVVSVELTTFYGNRTADGIQLFWTTATELNNHGYFIERQFEDLQWEIIGFIEGKGNSQNIEYYSFIDHVNSYQRMNRISYRIKQVDYAGNYEYYGSISFSCENSPNEFQLFANYPNPFNPTTRIGVFSINSTDIEFIISDISGGIVRKEIKNIPSGYSEIEWDGKNSENIALPAGIYIYTVRGRDFIQTKKMILLR